MKIDKEILEFLNREDVQGALARNDTQELYKLAADGQGHLPAGDIGDLTSILMQAGINPLLGMTEIPMCFLSWQGDIKEFNIPQGIIKIGRRAFIYTDLESITIPSSVREIGSDAFHKCENLKTIKLPTGVELYGSALDRSGLESIELKDVKLQGSFIFDDCKQLKSVTIKGDTPVIPNYTFENCTNLTHVELPEALEQIGHNVFDGCDKLREVNFAGTMDQWRGIEIDKDNRELFSCKIICSDGILKYNKAMKEWKQV